jgi:hypothetical protein
LKISVAQSKNHYGDNPRVGYDGAMHYLVIDNRFASPVYAFLDKNPENETGFPGLPVREVTLEIPDERSGPTPYSTGVACSATFGSPL